MLTIAAYSLDLPGYACARLRLLDPAAALRGRVDLRWAARSDGRNYAINASAMDGADIILFQRYFPMENTWPLVERALASGRPVIYDVDDNFLAVPEGHPMRKRLAPVEPYARELLARATLTTVSTAGLKRALSGVASKIEVLPNFLNTGLWGPLGGMRAFGRSGADMRAKVSSEAVESVARLHGPAPVRVVFAGTPSHKSDLAILRQAVKRLERRYGDRLRFHFLGCAPEGMEDRATVFDENYGAYAAALAVLSADIGLAPLQDNAFNRCKSAVKWLEYSALGMAGVYADLPPYAPVRHGETGLKAGRDPGAWEDAIARLVEDEPFRRGVGGRAAEEVLARWSLTAGAEAYFKVWTRVAHAGN